MIKISRKNGSSLQTTLYYVRLRTHDDIQLFAAAADSADEQDMQALLASIITDELRQAAGSHRGITLDQWLLEPDSLHALVTLEEQRPNQEVKGKPRLLTAFIAGLKAATAKRINLMRNQPGSPVWRRSYNEQLIEDEMMLARLRKKFNESENGVISG
ncbi:MAG: hypothetical protein AAFO84_10520 [Cyanobacteria bacterium J06598_1]